jgi:hypothetical protein
MKEEIKLRLVKERLVASAATYFMCERIEIAKDLQSDRTESEKHT